MLVKLRMKSVDYSTRIERVAKEGIVDVDESCKEDRKVRVGTNMKTMKIVERKRYKYVSF